jgi:hypothetical protein
MRTIAIRRRWPVRAACATLLAGLAIAPAARAGDPDPIHADGTIRAR